MAGAAVTTSRLARLEKLLDSYRDLPAEAIVKEELLTEGIAVDGSSAPGVASISAGPFSLRPTVVRIRANHDSPYRLREADAGFEVVDSSSGECLASARSWPERPSYLSKKFPDGTTHAEFFDLRGVATLPYASPKDAERLAQALGETFMLQPWESGETPLHIRLVPDEGIYGLAESAQDDFLLPYVEAIRHGIANTRSILLVLLPRSEAGERRLFDAGVTGRISNLEVWDRDVFGKLGLGAGLDRDTFVERILAQAYIYLENWTQPRLCLGKELSQPGGFTDVARAAESTREGICFLLKHRVEIRLQHWSPPGASPPVEYFLELSRFWYDTWRSAYRVELGGELIGPGRARDPDSSFLDVGRGAALAPLR